MFEIKTPTGKLIKIPQNLSSDRPYFSLHELDQALSYYQENGYVVIRKCIMDQLCIQARNSFIRDVKPYKGYLYRQTGGNPERNRFNEQNFLMNPILNIQDVPTKILGKFRDDSLAVILDDNIKIFLEKLFGEPAKLMQSMYFEGNTQTWPHQDSYYLDSEKIGSMIGAWYALEDIKPGAGRFFIYPKSHLIDMFKNGGEFDVAFHHDRYKKLNREIIDEHQLECIAPALNKGDVLFWHSKTIHGSLETRDPDSSRSSLTAHFIPESHRYLQFQAKIKKTRIKNYKGWSVNHPKSLDTTRAQIILFFETSFPKTFQFLKWSAVKLLITK